MNGQEDWNDGSVTHTFYRPTVVGPRSAAPANVLSTALLPLQLFDPPTAEDAVPASSIQPCLTETWGLYPETHGLTRLHEDTNPACNSTRFGMVQQQVAGFNSTTIARCQAVTETSRPLTPHTFQRATFTQPFLRSVGNSEMRDTLKVIQETGKQGPRPQKEDSRKKGDRCIRCKQYKQACFDHLGYPDGPCRRCVEDKNAIHRELCYKSEIIPSANWACIELETDRYNAIVRADAQISFLPISETIEIDYYYGHAFPRRISVHKVDVYDARQLNVSVCNWILNEYKDISTPSYAMSSRPQVNFLQFFDDLVEIYIEQLKTSMLMRESPMNPLHKRLILMAYEFAGGPENRWKYEKETRTREQKLVWKALQLWANGLSQSLYGTINPLDWQGEDRPNPVNDPDTTYHGKCMAPKLVDVQFAIYTAEVHAKLEQEAIEMMQKIIYEHGSGRWRKWVCCFLTAYMLLTSWEDDNYLYGWNKAHGRYDDDFNWPQQRKPDPEKLMERNKHLAEHVAHLFKVVCLGHELFQKDWNKEETRKIVKDEKMVVDFMKTIGVEISRQDISEIEKQRTFDPTYENDNESFTGRFSSWLCFC